MAISIGIPAEDRKAFLFNNVIDAKGNKFDMPVTVAFGSQPEYTQVGWR